jgi:hypothetical protein
MNNFILTTIAVLIFIAGFSQSFDSRQEPEEGPSAALNQIVDRYVEETIKIRPFLVYNFLSEFYEPDHSALPDRSPAALKTFEKIEDETLSFSTSLAQGVATNQELTTSAETLEEHLIGHYSELMEEYILHHNTDLYAKHTTEDYQLVDEIGLIEDRELVLTTVENLDFRSVNIQAQDVELLYESDALQEELHLVPDRKFIRTLANSSLISADVQSSDELIINQDLADTRQVPLSRFNPWDEVLKDTRSFDGYFRFHQKKDLELLIEILPEQLGHEFGLVMHHSGGRGIAGYPVLQSFLEPRLMIFKRIGDQVHLINRNPRYTADPGSPIEIAMAPNVGHSTIGAFGIEAEHAETGALLVNITDFFLSDYVDMAGSLRQGFANAPVNLDKSRSHVERVMGFPRNVEIDVQLTYSANAKPDQPMPRIADHRSIPVRIRFSLFGLPEEPMQPRYADQRIGHFVTAVFDFTRDRDRDPFLRYIRRWRLEKQDPGAEISEPMQQIVFYIDHSVPHEYRPYVREGIEAWNRAFEAAGFRNAVVARDAPDDPEWSAEDIRYSSVRWSAVPEFTGAVGPSQADPRTGETINSDVLIGYRRTGAVENMWQTLVSPFSQPYACRAQEGLVEGLAFQHAAMTALGVMAPGQPLSDQFVGNAIRDVVMHEIGHSLGLAHNLQASAAIPYDRLHDTAFTGEHGVTASVMDYITPNISADPEMQGHYWNKVVGSYDVWAIRYAYAPVYDASGATVTDPDLELPQLREWAERGDNPMHIYGVDAWAHLDPRAVTWDLGDDPLRFSTERLALINKVSEQLETHVLADGESFAHLFSAVRSIQVARQHVLMTTAPHIGGLYVSRDLKGQEGGQPSFTSVPLEDQRKALQLMLGNVFSPEPPISSELLNKVIPPSWDHWSMPNDWLNDRWHTPLDHPAHDINLQLQREVLAMLLDPHRLARIIDSGLRDEESMTLGELFGTIHDYIWSELDDRPVAVNSVRRNAQRAHIAALADLVLKERLPSPYWAYPDRDVPGDARAFARFELQRLSAMIDHVLNSRNRMDDTSRAHLAESKERINQVLAASVMLGGDS